MSTQRTELMAKGNVYLYHRNYVISKWGEKIIQRIEEELQPKWNEILTKKSFLSLEWIPHRFFLDLNVLFIKNIDHNHELFFRELGKNAVRHIINPVALSVLKFGTPNTFAAIAGVLWGRNYNMGKVNLISEKNQFLFILNEFNPGDKWTGYALLGCLESYVELIGYKVKTAEYRKSVLLGDTHEEYLVQWEK